jgi:hypothetical protein
MTLTDPQRGQTSLPNEHPSTGASRLGTPPPADWSSVVRHLVTEFHPDMPLVAVLRALQYAREGVLLADRDALSLPTASLDTSCACAPVTPLTWPVTRRQRP